MKSFFKIDLVSNIFEQDKLLFSKILQLDQHLVHQQWDLSSWQKLKLNQNQKYFLSLIGTDEQLTSFCLLESLESMGYAHILKVATDLSMRKQGLARLMLQQTLDYIKNNEKLERVLLEVDVDNTAANGFYVSMGFKPIHRKKSFYKNGNDAYVMELLL